ncbi:MAG: methylmalonyl-CoA epimerase [Proteobacteria bacterium]|nr:methylmalonyl-CoA epimerase [Pseudomonadota bacterium]
MIGRLNHVGVATPSIDDSLRFYRETLGATTVSPKRALPEQGVSVAFVDLPNTQIELIEPYGETSTLTAYLQKYPRGGQHHLCFEVDDILAARDELQGRGLTVLGSGEPRIGAHGTPVLFFHPRTTDGLLIEIMEAHHVHARAAVPGLED